MIALLRAQGAASIPISYARKKYGQTIGWPLGALIDALNLFPLDVSSTPTYTPSPSPTYSPTHSPTYSPTPSPTTTSSLPTSAYYSGSSFVQPHQNFIIKKSKQEPMQPHPLRPFVSN